MITKKWSGLPACALAWSIITSCGGAPAVGETNEGDVAIERSDHDAQDDEISFSKMAFGERKMFMEDVVFPKMKGLFVEAHPDFSCSSCHGADMTQVNFEMPNGLEPLNPAAMPFDSANEDERKTANWMKDTVVPTMAGLLMEPPYNPETQQGFGCFECHAKGGN